MCESAKSAANAPLDYVPAPRWYGRRAWRRMVIVVVLLGGTAAALRWGPALWLTMRLLYWQRQALNYTASPDQIVYEEQPQSAKKLLAGTGGYAPFTTYSNSNTMAAFVPVCQSKLSGVLFRPGPLLGPTLFLHELKTPDGRSHLVLVEYQVGSNATRFNCRIEIIRPATPLKPAATAPNSTAMLFTPAGSQDPQVRVYAGQPDPADPSHFTIRYEMWGQSDILDGRIDNTPRVTLTAKNRPQRPARPP
jgi:hypothetical protein